MASMVAIGIALGSLGSIAINTGNNLQSLGMAQLEMKDHEEAAAEAEEAEKDGNESPLPLRKDIDTCKSTTWVVGTCIFVTGSILNFVAFAFAPQSVLASLEGIQFVTNVLFGKLVLGKEVTNLMYGGTAVIVLGVVLTVWSASVVGTLEADVEMLLEFWVNPVWIFYLICCGGGGVWLQGTHKAYDRANTLQQPLPYTEYVLPITYATFSALFGTFSVVLAKVLSELVTIWITGVDIFFGRDAWFTWATLLGWLAFVGVWLFRMNEALSLYDPLFIIPLLQVNFILFAIVSGGIFFKEFYYFQLMNVVGFAFGVSFLVLGIYMLSPVLDDDNQSETTEEGGLESGESVAGDSSSTDKKSSSEKKEATSTLQGAISVQGSNNEAGKNEKQNNRSQSTGLSSSTSSKSALKNASSKPFRPATASVSEDYKDGSNSSNSNDGNNEKEAKKQSVGYSLPPILSSPNNASSSGTGYVYKAGSIDSAMQHAPPPSTVRSHHSHRGKRPGGGMRRRNSDGEEGARNPSRARTTMGNGPGSNFLSKVRFNAVAGLHDDTHDSNVAKSYHSSNPNSRHASFCKTPEGGASFKSPEGSRGAPPFASSSKELFHADGVMTGDSAPSDVTTGPASEMEMEANPAVESARTASAAAAATNNDPGLPKDTLPVDESPPVLNAAAAASDGTGGSAPTTMPPAKTATPRGGTPKNATTSAGAGAGAAAEALAADEENDDATDAPASNLDVVSDSSNSSRDGSLSSNSSSSTTNNHHHSSHSNPRSRTERVQRPKLKSGNSTNGNMGNNNNNNNSGGTSSGGGTGSGGGSGVNSLSSPRKPAPPRSPHATMVDSSANAAASNNGTSTAVASSSSRSMNGPSSRSGNGNNNNTTSSSTSGGVGSGASGTGGTGTGGARGGAPGTGGAGTGGTPRSPLGRQSSANSRSGTNTNLRSGSSGRPRGAGFGSSGRNGSGDGSNSRSGKNASSAIGGTGNGSNGGGGK